MPGLKIYTDGGWVNTLLDNASAQYKYLVSGATPYTYAESAGYLNIASGKTLVISEGLTLTAGAAGQTFTFPSVGGTVALLNAANVFTAIQKINVNSTTALLVEQDGVMDNILVVDTTNGYVFLGTADPSLYTTNIAKLTVVTPDSIPFAQVKYTDTAGAGSGMHIRRARGTESSPTVVQNNNTIGGITWQGYSAAAGLFLPLASIAGLVDGTPDSGGSTTDMPGRLQFSTTPEGSATLSIRMIIDNDGLTTIGATKGTARFEVKGTTDVVQLLVTGHTTNAVATPIIQFTRNDTAAGISAMLGLTALGSGAAGDGGSILFKGKSSTTAAQGMGLIDFRWIVATHATRTSALRLYAEDYGATRLGLEIQGNGTATLLGFFGVPPVVQPTAYTQTYSTASKTNPTATAANLVTTAATQTTPWGFASQAQADDIATQVNKMQTDYINLQKLVNAIIDDQQALGLAL